MKKKKKKKRPKKKKKKKETVKIGAQFTVSALLERLGFTVTAPLKN